MRFTATALLFLTLSTQAAEVRVFAAASLSEALTDIARDYERETGDTVVFNFGGSSMLARQIAEGAPADLFVSADEAKMDALAQAGLIDPRTRTSLLSNTLVIVVAADSRRRFMSPGALAGSLISRIALAEPSSVPAGIYARQYLIAQGLWECIQPKVIPVDNVRAALAAVESGNVDAAIVYRTDALISKQVRIAYEIPRDQAPAISYPFAVVKAAAEPAAARRLLALLRSKEALAVFARYGFLIR